MITAHHVARFLDLVEPQEDGCWLWTGLGNTTSPYGKFWVGHTERYAHRIAHLIFIGPIPADYEVDHLCNRPLCVNPDHLEAVTRDENVRRAVERRTKPGHGTVARYKHHRCRCALCRASWATFDHARRQARAARLSALPAEAHGRKSLYANWGCRCDACRAAYAEYQADRKRKAVA